jgi:vacuolar-type H+-ATPase subunit C/Vma6
MMKYMTFVYKWNSRELRKIILAILKSWMADNIKRLNYAQNYSLQEKWIKKEEEKMVLIHTENVDDLLVFLSKNFPQIEKIDIN